MFRLSIVTSVKSWTLEDSIRQRHSTSDRWGSKSERTGRGMLGGKGVVQGSWRRCYWTGSLLYKVNRNLKDRACIPLQVLVNNCSLLFINNERHTWLIKFDNNEKKSVLILGYWKNIPLKTFYLIVFLTLNGNWPSSGFLFYSITFHLFISCIIIDLGFQKA